MQDIQLPTKQLIVTRIGPVECADRYVVEGFSLEGHPGKGPHEETEYTSVLFERGSRDGVTSESLLVILLDRHQTMQIMGDGSDENAECIEHLRAAIRCVRRVETVH